MKKFNFNLDKVLKFKEQIENSLRGEHARAVQAVAKQERLVLDLENKSLGYAKELDLEKKNGSTVLRLRMYEDYIENMQKRIQREKEVLVILKEKEEEKRREVISARTETSSISKLKEKKLLEYGRDVQKEEERLVEEFVVNAMASQGR